MNIKKLALAGVAAAFFLTSFAGVAFASSIPGNFPGDNGISCDAWHGAPGGFGPDSPYYTVAQSPNVTALQFTGLELGQAQGVGTGQGNAAFSALCN
jgi:hypothetical protein